MKSRRRILIVGGDGKIGHALADLHRKAGDTVTTTTRRAVTSGSFIALDLATVSQSWQPPAVFDIAYLCGAITAVKGCEEDPAGTARVNVEGTLTVARALKASGAFIVFLSTNLVFDGTVSAVPTDATPGPRCVYGRQKAAVETELLKNPESTAIVRLTKVIEPEHPLLNRWLIALLQGEAISPFADSVMAPVSLQYAAGSLQLIAERQQPGIAHLSASADFSYADAACYLAQRLGADPSLVRPVTSQTAGQTIFSPAHTTLAPGGILTAGDSPPPTPTAALEPLLRRGLSMTSSAHAL